MIEFLEVWARRGGREVLRGVSLRVAPGEVVALAGASGAGKTTLLRLVNRLTEPSRGEVKVEGRSTDEWPLIELRRSIGYVIQEAGLFPHLSVAQNIGTVPRLLGWSADRIGARTGELLALVGLEPREYSARWPDELSGGQRQRVGLARALAADPAILLMDEPFSALDPITRSGLHAEFRSLQRRLQRTVLLVTHDVSEMFTLADRVAVLDAGQLATCGSPEELQASLHPSVRALLNARRQ